MGPEPTRSLIIPNASGLKTRIGMSSSTPIRICCFHGLPCPGNLTLGDTNPKTTTPAECSFPPFSERL
jgi:hypothetical protein